MQNAWVPPEMREKQRVYSRFRSSSVSETVSTMTPHVSSHVSALCGLVASWPHDVPLGVGWGALSTCLQHRQHRAYACPSTWVMLNRDAIVKSSPWAVLSIGCPSRASGFVHTHAHSSHVDGAQFTALPGSRNTC